MLFDLISVIFNENKIENTYTRKASSHIKAEHKKEKKVRWSDDWFLNISTFVE
jgi:hypothetical protein